MHSFYEMMVQGVLVHFLATYQHSSQLGGRKGEACSLLPGELLGRSIQYNDIQLAKVNPITTPTLVSSFWIVLSQAKDQVF